MGLFDKKYCDVCGEKIGLLGNRKLEDGNLCKDCARKLSPFFNSRRDSTVAEIKDQLAYREENERQLASFRPTRTFGTSTKLYIDDTAGKFIVTHVNDWRSANPDIISLSQVISCNLTVDENRDEIYYNDNEGNRRSYSPPRYKYEYRFNIIINVTSPWFSQIEFELSSFPRPDSRYTEMYREYERQANEICAALMRRDSGLNNAYRSMPYSQVQQNFSAAPNATSGCYDVSQQQYNSPMQQTYASVSTTDSTWICPSCATSNVGGKFCQNCGAPK